MLLGRGGCSLTLMKENILDGDMCWWQIGGVSYHLKMWIIRQWILSRCGLHLPSYTIATDNRTTISFKRIQSWHSGIIVDTSHLDISTPNNFQHTPLDRYYHPIYPISNLSRVSSWSPLRRNLHVARYLQSVLIIPTRGTEYLAGGWWLDLIAYTWQNADARQTKDPCVASRKQHNAAATFTWTCSNSIQFQHSMDHGGRQCWYHTLMRSTSSSSSSPFPFLLALL